MKPINDRIYIALFLTGLVCWLFGAILFSFGRSGSVLSDAEAQANLDRLWKMDAGQYRTFYRSQEQFYQLPQEEQDKLRSFYAAVHAAADCEKLEQTLVADRHWLTTLTPPERSEMQNRKLTDEQRIEKSRAILESHKPDSTAPRPFPPVLGPEPTDKELAEFWEKMPVNEKNAKLAMLPEQMLESIKREYHASKRPLRQPRPRQARPSI